jgi:hypothetical protein
MAEVPAASPQEKEDKARVPSRAREWITSVILITFTSLVGIGCVIALSSTLTQARMTTITIDGVPLSIWKLDDIRVQWAEIRDVIRTLSEGITEAERDRMHHTAVAAKAEQEFRGKQRALIVKLGEIIFRLRTLDPEVARTVEGTRDSAERYAHVGLAQARLLGEHPDLKSRFEELDAAYGEYSRARDDNTAAGFIGEAIITRIKKLQDAVSGSRTSLETLYRQINPKFGRDPADAKGGAAPTEVDDTTRSRIENALYELHSGRGILGTFINRLVTTQPDILTLTLVLLMGILGSSLQMTYAFFKQHQIEKVGEYLLRVCVGAITALVIFIVAKAGVPVIADASRLGGDAAINPYFVSFLAIISGLMSDNAVRSVQNQGARFFGADAAAEPPRWARLDLREMFKASNRDPDRVRRLLQAKDDEFEDWVSGKRPMPANVQMMIAGVLQTPPRDLFTDIPPDQAGTTS